MTDPRNIVVQMDLPTIGELTAVVAKKALELRYESTDLDEDDYRVLCKAAWDHIVFMHDRAEFAKAAQADIASLESTDGPLQ